MNEKEIYETKDVVDFYLNCNELQQPEQVILNKIEPTFLNGKILDIGVGTGRTTLYLANKVNEYIGIDYSKLMIDECIIRFSNLKNVTFLNLDVRNLSGFDNNTFDFILFSFNGIDHLHHDERVLVLSEINRIGKKDSYFTFSSHNIQNVTRLFTVKWDSNIYRMFKYLFYYFRLIFHNGLPNKYNNKLYSNLIDGAHQFRLKPMYIKPNYQIKLLREAGFDNIGLYSLSNGNLIKEDLIDNIEDAWLTYLCRNNKSK